MRLIRRSSGRFTPRNEFSVTTPMAPELRAHRRPGFTLTAREDKRDQTAK